MEIYSTCEHSVQAATPEPLPVSHQHQIEEHRFIDKPVHVHGPWDLPTKCLVHLRRRGRQVVCPHQNQVASPNEQP